MTLGKLRSIGVGELDEENGYRDIPLQMTGAQERSEETTPIPFLELIFYFYSTLSGR